MATETVVIDSLTPPVSRLRHSSTCGDIEMKFLDDVTPFLSRVQEDMWALMEAQRVCLLESQVHWKTLEDRRIALEAALIELQQRNDFPQNFGSNGEINGERTTDTAEPEEHVTLKKSASMEDNIGGSQGITLPTSSTVIALCGSEEDNSQASGQKKSHSRPKLKKRKSLLHEAISQVGHVDRHDTITSEREPGDLPKWKRFLTSPKFDLWVGVLIIMNCVVMSLQLEYDGQLVNPACNPNCEDKQWDFAETAFAAIEQVFTAAFAFELGLRLAASGLGYLKHFLNAMDGVIVLVSVIDSWVLTPLGSEGMSNVAILRLVRLVRLSKVLRVVRVMKAFKSLRVLVSAVAASVGALAWSMTLLFVLELSGAIFLAQILRPYMEDPDRDMASREFLWMRFGTWVRSMLSIFEITMAPGGFINYRIISDKVHPGFGVFFAMYVCIVTFAVVRVITALFLKTTLSASDQDEARLNADRARQQNEYARLLHSSIAAMCGHHTEASWRMDKHDLEAIMETPQMHEWLRDVELPPSDADRLFNALDPGDGMVPFNDFVNALMRMRGTPRAADAVLSRAETFKILQQLERLEENMQDIFPLRQRFSVLGQPPTSPGKPYTFSAI